MTGERLSNKIPEDLTREPRVSEPTKTISGLGMATAGGALLTEPGLVRPAAGAGLVFGGILATMPEAIKAVAVRRTLANVRAALRKEVK